MSQPRAKNLTGRRRWMWAVLTVVAIVLVLLALRPSPVAVDLATVERGAMRVTLDEEGETRVRERYVVSAPVSGRVLRIELEPGDAVHAGKTLLATFQPAAPSLLDSRTRAEAEARFEAAQADLGLSRASLARADAEYRFAVSELERIGRLAESRIVSQDLLDSAQLLVDTGSETRTAAEYAVRTAEHNVKQARATLMQGVDGDSSQKPITIRSPVDGVVLRRLHESSSVVPAGEPLVEVADPSQLEIVADFLSEDAVKIPAGAQVVIDRWGGEPLAARVRRVEPSGFTKISALGVEEQRVNVIVDFEDPHEAWTALGDGFRVEVRVVIWNDPDVLRLPVSCLFRSESGWAVFAVDGGKARLTPVEIGQRNALVAQVLSGVNRDERIILHPSDAIADGVAVEERGS